MVQQCISLTFPQALQWCRLSVRLKSVVQFMHIITCETGTSTGAVSPSAIHSFSRACWDNIGYVFFFYSLYSYLGYWSLSQLLLGKKWSIAGLHTDRQLHSQVAEGHVWPINQRKRFLD